MLQASAQNFAGALVVGLLVGVVLDRFFVLRHRERRPRSRSRPGKAKKLYFVRHGQAEHNVNAADNYALPRDAPLTEDGIAQARHLRHKLLALAESEGLHFDLAVSSPLTRAIQTARVTLEGMDIPLSITPLISERLCEPCDLGTTTSELAARFPGVDFKDLEEVWWAMGEVSGFFSHQ